VTFVKDLFEFHVVVTVGRYGLELNSPGSLYNKVVRNFI